MVWPFRRSWFVRRFLGSVAKVCAVLVGVCAVVTLLFVAAFGHPLLWSLVGVTFALLPLFALLVVASVHVRGAVVAGRGWVGVRVLRRWRLVDLGSVRAVRVVPGAPFGPFGARSNSGRTVLLEDDEGRSVGLDIDAMDPAFADVVRDGLGSGVAIDAEARAALGRD